jgi:hypothetical protein
LQFVLQITFRTMGAFEPLPMPVSGRKHVQHADVIAQPSARGVCSDAKTLHTAKHNGRCHYIVFVRFRQTVSHAPISMVAPLWSWLMLCRPGVVSRLACIAPGESASGVRRERAALDAEH